MVSLHSQCRRALLFLLLLSSLVVLPCWANPQQRRLQHRSPTSDAAQTPGRSVLPRSPQDLLALPQSSISETEPVVPLDAAVVQDSPRDEEPTVLPDDALIPEHITPWEILGGIAVLIFLVVQGLRRRRRA